MNETKVLISGAQQEKNYIILEITFTRYMVLAKLEISPLLALFLYTALDF